MLFPVIKIKDKDFDHIHIVGTNSHDQLYIDEETGGIQYLDLQCMGSTKKRNNDQYCKFVGSESKEHGEKLLIDFVTIEELIEIAIKNMKEQTDNKLELDNMILKYFEEKEKCQERLNDSTPDTSGMLY